MTGARAAPTTAYVVTETMSVTDIPASESIAEMFDQTTAA